MRWCLMIGLLGWGCLDDVQSPRPPAPGPQADGGTFDPDRIGYGAGGNSGYGSGSGSGSGSGGQRPPAPDAEIDRGPDAATDGGSDASVDAE